MNMYSWSLVILVVTLAVLVVAGSLIEPEPVPRTRVYRVPPRWLADTMPLAPMPGEDEWTWAGEFAAPVDATLAAADAYIARHYQGLTR